MSCIIKFSTFSVHFTCLFTECVSFICFALIFICAYVYKPGTAVGCVSLLLSKYVLRQIV